MNVPNGCTISGFGFCPKDYPLSEHARMKTQLIENVLIPNPFDKRLMKVTCNWKRIVNKEAEDDKEL
jgi:hypothetical protein